MVLKEGDRVQFVGQQEVIPATSYLPVIRQDACSPRD